MKTLRQVQDECLTEDVFTTAEFLELFDEGAISPYDYDSYGYYHDGESLTEIPVCLYRDDIIEKSSQYPYVVWRFLNNYV